MIVIVPHNSFIPDFSISGHVTQYFLSPPIHQLVVHFFQLLHYQVVNKLSGKQLVIIHHYR